MESGTKEHVQLRSGVQKSPVFFFFGGGGGAFSDAFSTMPTFKAL